MNTSKVSTKAILDAQDAGYRASWKGLTPAACPYYGPDNPVTDPDEVALLRDAWSAGWAAAATDLRGNSNT